MLGDLGAEVIKIEYPVEGDPERGYTRLEGSRIMDPDRPAGILFHITNRNKKGITLDLTKEEGKQILYRLVEKSDVFLQNFRPGVAARLGADYQTLKKFNPKLIYMNVSGYGPKGPESHLRGQDYIGLARSGFLSAVHSGDDELPHVTGAIADHMTCTTAAYGILAALLARERMGIGQEIHTSLFGSMLGLQAVRIGQTLMMGREPAPRRRREMLNPIYNHYRCADGKWIALAVLASDRVWPDVCKALGMEEMEKDPRFDSTEKRAENCRELIETLDRTFATKPRDEWLQLLRQYRRIICSPVLDPLDLVEDPQTLENDYIVELDDYELGRIKQVGCPVTFTETPAQVQSPSPMFGQHTEDVLLGIGGYTWEDIARFRESGVI
jgi:crotonobetainyl-CoA:carnitine CoA-transferase CaiB-like acyl-CoA transferase